MYIVSPFVFDKNLCPIVLNFFLYIKSNRCSSEYGYVDNIHHAIDIPFSIIKSFYVHNCGYL